MHEHRKHLTAALAILAFTGATFAQSEPAKPADTPQSPPPVLSGPKVSERAQAKTLIEKDETGRIKRLDVPPPEAALRLLDLDEATKAKTRPILEERAATLDRIVRDNLLLLVNIANAGKAQDKAESRRLLRELADKAEPLRARGQLQEELAAALPADKAAEMKRLVREYATAIVAETQALSEKSAEGMESDAQDDKKEEGKARGPQRTAAARAAAQQEYVAGIGRELKRSYERVVTAAVKDFDELIKELNLAPEKEAEIRRIATDHFQKTAGKPTPAQKGEVFAKIYAELNAEQRRILLKRVSGKQDK